MRSRSLLRLTGAAVFAFCGVRHASANAIDDFRLGSTLFLRAATVEMGGDAYNTGGIQLPKPGGTLDFPLAASDIGLSLPITVHLHGAPIGNQLIMYNFSETFSPGVDVDGQGDHLESATGSLMVHVDYVGGSQSPQCGSQGCMGNVRLTVMPGVSTITVHGDWGDDQTIMVDHVELVGGLPRPAIAAFANGSTQLVCSDTVQTKTPVTVWLTSPAPTGGAKVDFTGPFHHGVTLPSSVFVPAGHLTVAVDAQIRANYFGTVHLTASSGGAQASLDLAIEQHSDCDPPDSGPLVAAWVPDIIAGCQACTQFVGVNDWGEKLTTINGAISLVRNGAAIDLGRIFSTASWVGADSINDSGFIAGRITIGGLTQAYRASMRFGSPSPELLGVMTPKAINGYGTIVGFRVVPSTGLSVATYALGHGVVDLPLASSLGIASSRALDTNDAGQITGTYTDGNGNVRGFRFVNGTTSTLPVIGTHPALPVALDAAGDIAVNGADAAGTPLAAVISPAGVVTRLGVPAGFTSFRATAINRWGYVAGVATGGGTTSIERAFAWLPGHGFVALTGYVKGLVATDAVAITNSNKVVVSGTYAGSTDLYLVSL